MWLFGYAVGVSGSPQFDAGAVGGFDASLTEWCASHPGDSLFDALSAPNRAVPKPRPAAFKPAVPKAAAPKPAAPQPAAPQPATPQPAAPGVATP
jgi:hypothetical protein